MEMSDLILINKADGSNKEKANMARAVYANALHLFPPTESGWVPTALAASSIEKSGLDLVWEKIQEYFKLVRENGYYDHRRLEQDRWWMYETINNSIKDMFYENEIIEKLIPEYEEAVLEGRIDSFSAAAELLDKYLGK